MKNTYQRNWIIKQKSDRNALCQLVPGISCSHTCETKVTKLSLFFLSESLKITDQLETRSTVSVTLDSSSIRLNTIRYSSCHKKLFVHLNTFYLNTFISKTLQDYYNVLIKNNYNLDQTKTIYLRNSSGYSYKNTPDEIERL